MQRPPVKSAPAPAAKEEAPVVAPPKSKKWLMIIIVILLMAIAGGAGWFFSKGSAPAADKAETAKAKEESAQEAKFVPLGENFTVNLQREEGDRYLQAGITLKILQPELEEKIKTLMPEIRSKLLFLLSSKKPSELQTIEGKKKLIAEIITATDSVLGVGDAPAEETAAVAEPAEADASAPADAQPAPIVEPKTTGVVDVLFTSFIIQ
jgi:flagellar FliL protein